MKRHDRQAVLALLPALALVSMALLGPLLWTLAMAVRDPEMAATLPRSAELLRAWDGEGLPPEEAFAAVARELRAAEQAQAIGGLVRRLNFDRTGMRTLLLRTARADLAAPYAAAMAALDARWADPETWQVLRRSAGPATPLYLLRAVDLDLTPAGEVVAVEPGQAMFRRLFLRTLEISLTVTLICVVVGYPVAWTITVLPRPWAGLATALVLVPFWISVLVRTTAWLILLQREGPLNALLLALRVTDTPFEMIFTRGAVYLAMVHVLLPFVILPLVGVMRRIDPVYLRAAGSLGASGPVAFLRVYLPMTLPGVAAGALITFMMAVGFYVTPALVGGSDDQMVSTWIAEFANSTLNWGMAAALACLLLAMTAAAVGAARLLLPRTARS